MGRGSSGTGGGGKRRSNASSDGALTDIEPIELEVKWKRANGSWGGNNGYSKTVLDAATDGNGNVTFTYAKPESMEKQSNSTSWATFRIAHGAVDGETRGINWDKVNSISGVTYDLRGEAKAAGLRWDGKRKIWKRP